ncbi:MAG: serine hydrolase domain-containing protein [Cyclobacteriaceae bacterium]
MNIYRTIIILLLSITNALGQATAEIDKLFENWDSKDKPGIAVGIIHQDKVIYSKGFGLANLETHIPITPSTEFMVAEMSKHFTAFAVLLLEEQGKLSLNEDIRKYVNYLPEFNETITIGNLLNLSNGLPDLESLALIAGWGNHGMLTHREAQEIISKLNQLDFIPGEAFSYYSPSFTILSDIVAAVSGKSFEDFTKNNIFVPLEMRNTSFSDYHGRIIAKRAIPYRSVDGEFMVSDPHVTSQGAMNLYTSIGDLCKWELNLITPKIGSVALVQKLNTPISLKSGKLFSPTFGTVTQGHQLIHKERGISKIYQTGVIGGYASSVFKFPAQDFTVIVLSNDGMPYNGYLGMQASYLFLEDKFLEPATIDFSKLDSKKLKKETLEGYCGNYWNEFSGNSRSIKLLNDTLRYVNGSGNGMAMIPLSNSKFQVMRDGDDRFIIEFKNNGQKKIMEYSIGDSDKSVLKAYKPVTYTTRELKAYEGTFHNSLLNISYHFVVEDNKLVAKKIKTKDIQFTPVSVDQFEGSEWFFGNVNFERDCENQIAGFNLSFDGVKNLGFVKIYE